MRLTRRALALSGLAAAIAPVHAATVLAPPLSKLVKTQPEQPVTGLSITREDGSTEDLSAYRGRIVVLNLWGSWCFPCRDEMPALSRLAAAVAGDSIAVLPLAIERKGPAAVHRFFEETGISNLPLRLGTGENIAQVFKAWGLPYTVLIDAQGREFARVTGAAQWDNAAFLTWLKTRV